MKGKQLEQGQSYWEITDKRIRHSKLAEIVRTVKSYADLKLNNGLDVIIDADIKTRAVKTIDFNEGHDDMIWEVDSCPDLFHGKEKVSPGEPEDLNLSWPGLNQEINPLEKQRSLMDFFNKMAELDAEKERHFQEKITKEKMKVDKACMHDTELVDNCFFSSK